MPQVVEESVLMTPPLIDRVEPSSFVAAGDRLHVHLNSTYSTAFLEDPGHLHKVLMFLRRSQNKWRHKIPEKGKLEKLSSKHGLISGSLE